MDFQMILSDINILVSQKITWWVKATRNGTRNGKFRGLVVLATAASGYASHINNRTTSIDRLRIDSIADARVLKMMVK
jgi:hypothetical protein